MPGGAVAVEAELPVLGYYGKVPTRGDFVQRGLPRSFLDPWDQWLQRSVAASREQLGEAWLDSYLTSPIWRFMLAGGICGDMVSVGVLMPSVDSVGRYFPMTIAGLLPVSQNLLAVAARGASWFAAVEEIAHSCLEQGFQLDSFEQRLAGLDVLPTCDGSPGGSHQALPEGLYSGLSWPLDGTALNQLFTTTYPEILDSLVRARLDSYSLWWTAGSDRVEPSMRICQGLPAGSDYARYLCDAVA